MSVMFMWVSGVMFGLAVASGVSKFLWGSLIAAVTGLALVYGEDKNNE